MFQESLVESTPLLRTQNRWPVLISFVAQAAVLTLAITIPLLHPEILPKEVRNKLDFLPAPRVRPPTPPPQPPVRIQTAPTNSAPAAPAMQAPQIPTTAAHPFVSDALPVEDAIIPMTGGNPSTNTTPFAPASPPAPHVVPAPTAPPGPLHISEGVLAGNLVSPIRAQYPAIARAAGVQGTVIIQATISTTGVIVNAHVVSGPIMLQSAALDAVRNARYRPYLLNHQPTEVDTTFSINFHLGS
jgi:protein TonB